jgi:hypothetical protein
VKRLEKLIVYIEKRHKAGATENEAPEEMRTIKKSSTLHQENMKDTLRISQEFSRPYPSQPQGYKDINAFNRLSLDKIDAGVP